jgi:hypothetical protein
MLKQIQKTFGKYQFAIEKKLFVYDAGYCERDAYKNHSGIRATIFGPTGIYFIYSGVVGYNLAAKLGELGS